MMKAVLKSGILGVFLILLLMCSCATENSVSPRRLPDAAINKNAARGNEMLVMLRLEDGEELPCIVDTGSPCTVLDISLEPKLGKRLGTVTLWNFGSRLQSSVYAAPKLFLGNAPLAMSGNGILTMDFNPWSAKAGCSIMGFLGMDVLENYCIQMDFEAGQLRFLDPEHLDAKNLGKAFPLVFLSEDQGGKDWTRPYIRHDSLIGGSATNLLVDTGYRADGALMAEFFLQQVKKQRVQEGNVVRGDNGRIWFSKAVWDGETYTNLLIGEGGNLIGLGFLARHLVTLNFPGRMMYLKQTTVGPPTDDNKRAAEVFFTHLKEDGKLPGWARSEKGTIYNEEFPNYVEFDCRKNKDSSDYHYRIIHEAKSNSWRLQKAWKTDEDDNTIEEFPVP
jgi:hypothetical protein